MFDDMQTARCGVCFIRCWHTSDIIMSACKHRDTHVNTTDCVVRCIVIVIML